MRFRLLVPALLLVLPPSAAQGKSNPFEGSDLLTGRGIKPPKETQLIQVGLNVGTSPLSALMGFAKDKIKDYAIGKCNGVATCEAIVNDGIDGLKDVPDQTWDEIRNLAGQDGTNAEIEKKLVDKGVPSEVAKGVSEYIAKTSPEDRQKIVDAAKIGSKSEASVNLLMEPFVRVNTKWIDVGLGVPFTLRIKSAKDTDASFGNITLDARSGKVWSAGPVHLGITGGLSLYLPTGSKAADESGRADMFQAPKVMHQYLGFAPYLVLGLDLDQWLLLMGHAEYLAEAGVRDKPTYDSFHVMKWGLGIVAFPSFWVNVIAELNGLSGLKNADAFNVGYFTGGLQLKISIFRLALAVQYQAWNGQKAKDGLANLGGVPVGDLAKFNILCRALFTF